MSSDPVEQTMVIATVFDADVYVRVGVRKESTVQMDELCVAIVCEYDLSFATATEESGCAMNDESGLWTYVGKRRHCCTRSPRMKSTD